MNDRPQRGGNNRPRRRSSHNSDRSEGQANHKGRGGHNRKFNSKSDSNKRYKGNSNRNSNAADKDSEERPHRGSGDRRRNGGQQRKHGHAGRGGQGRSKNRYQPERRNFREERDQKRQSAPTIPSEIQANDLDPMVRQDLKVLSKDNADRVARHMVAAAMFMDEDPKLALKHARAAKERGGRVAVARETCGIAAYRAGEWKEALSELRAARRISGGPGLLAVMADCERGLGRPAKAIEMGDTEEARQLDPDSAVELAIVIAGARQDMGDYHSAVVLLEHHHPEAKREPFAASRISYAYAHALELDGELQAARHWFERTVQLDEDKLTDAQERIEKLTQKIEDNSADDSAR